MASYADGSLVPKDGKYHVDPTNPMVSVRYLEPWYPPGVTEPFSGGNTACLGLLLDGTVLKYVRDREDRHALNSLNVEHHVLSALGKHDGIVEYLGRHEHGLLLRRAVNGDVYSYISKREHDSVSLQLRQRWITQTAEALSFVHSNGVVHCDLHPNNVLIDEHLNVRLCDFAGSLFGVFDGGAMESTRFFLPRDWRTPPNEQSDLFALGSTMYYIMTSHMPYEGIPDDEIVVKYERKEFPNVEGLICGRAIEGCWTGGFKSAEDVLRAISEGEVGFRISNSKSSCKGASL